jgi:hypothetical protein
MKYLKLFESFTTPEDIVNDLKDICLDLNDIYVDTNCEYYHPKVVNGEIYGDFISVGMEKMDFTDYNDVLSWGDISDTIDRVLEYLNSVDWKLSSIIIDGDNLINPLEWIENLRKKPEYTIYGLTMHFVKD